MESELKYKTKNGQVNEIEMPFVRIMLACSIDIYNKGILIYLLDDNVFFISTHALNKRFHCIDRITYNVVVHRIISVSCEIRSEAALM